MNPALKIRLFFIVKLLGVAVIATIFVAIIMFNKKLSSFEDFVGFWCFGTVLSQDSNPYNYDTLKEKCPVSLIPSVVFNPPLIAPLALTLASLDFQHSFLALLIFSIVIFTSTLLLVKEPQLLLYGILYLSSSPFFIQTVSLGQISLIPYAGILIGTILLNKHRPLMAGMFWGLTLLKPNLIFLTYALVVASSAQRIPFLIGTCCSGLIQLTITYATAPQIFSWYKSLQVSEAISYFQPTLASYLKLLTGMHSSLILMWLPLLFALTIIPKFYKRPMSEQQLIGLSLPVSLLVAPYAWSYDFTLISLCPFLITLNIKSSKILFLSLTVLNLARYFSHTPMGYDIWYPLAAIVLIYFLKLQKRFDLA